MNKSFLQLSTKIRREGKGPNSYKFLHDWSPDAEINDLLCNLNLDDFDTRYKNAMKQHKTMDTYDLDTRNKITAEYTEVTRIKNIIIETCKENIWFFLGKILQVPHDMICPDKPIIDLFERDEQDTSFPLSEWAMLYIWCKQNHIHLWLNGFYGMEWTLVTSAIVLHNMICRRTTALCYYMTPVRVIVSNDSEEQRKLAFIPEMVDAMKEATIKRYSFLTALFTEVSYLLGSPTNILRGTVEETETIPFYTQDTYESDDRGDLIDIRTSTPDGSVKTIKDLSGPENGATLVHLAISKDQWDTDADIDIIHFIAIMEDVHISNPQLFTVVREKLPYLKFSANISQYFNEKEWEYKKSEIERIVCTSLNNSGFVDTLGYFGHEAIADLASSE